MAQACGTLVDAEFLPWTPQRGSTEPIDSGAALSRFLEERASFLAETSLYGYLHTRAGMRYPELFDDDPFVASINVAKWHLWLDCLADLSVYAGSRLAQDGPRIATNRTCDGRPGGLGP